jgi:hypothetical protein
MTRKPFLSLSLLAAMAAIPPANAKADQLVPAGSVLQCTVAEARISSQTEKVGDPILCQLGHTEVYGRTVFPYGSYLEGHFQAYKDPGHFVGKGWMELRFDRLIVEPDTIVPIDARVVQTPKYRVDANGRIQGNGHAVRDTVEWLIPVLWPIDLINLPRRGPRPVLAPETRLTLKVLEDFGIPTPQENAVREPALISRVTPDEPTYQSYQPAPVQRQYAPEPPQQQSYAPAPQQYAPQQYAPSVQQYAPQQSYAPQQAYSQPQVVVQVMPQQQPPPTTVVVQQQAPMMPYAMPVYVPTPAYMPYRYYGYRMGPWGPY